jgi:hypothetical protein
MRKTKKAKTGQETVSDFPVMMPLRLPRFAIAEQTEENPMVRYRPYRADDEDPQGREFVGFLYVSLPSYL